MSDRPVLRIPKDAVQDGRDGSTGFTYYSRRGTEVEEDCDPPKKRRGSLRQFLRKNRGLAITLLDVLILVVIFVLFQTILGPRLQRDSPPGLGIDFAARAHSLDGGFQLVVEAQATTEAAAPQTGGEFFFVVLDAAEGAADRGELRAALEVLDAGPLGQEILGQLARASVLDFVSYRDLLPEPGNRGEYSASLSVPSGHSGTVNFWLIVRVDGYPAAILQPRIGGS